MVDIEKNPDELLLEEDEDIVANDRNEPEIDDTLVRVRKTSNEIIDEIDPDDVEGYEWCDFNRQALGAVQDRINKKIVYNPTTETVKVKYKKKMQFFDSIVRDCFPEFSYKKFGVRRSVFFALVLRSIVLPLVKDEKLNFIEIEGEFNDILLHSMIENSLDN